MKTQLLSIKISVLISVMFIFQYVNVSGLTGDYKFFPDIDGWKKPDSPKVYNPGNLWDLINGAADLYLSYDFEELTVGNYTKEEGVYIVVEIYRHATVNDAFGIYSMERPLTGSYIQTGAQGYEAKGVLNFISANYYVKVSSHHYDKETEASMRTLSGSIASLISHEASLPSVLALFPEEFLVKNSEQYINSNFLGMSFLGNTFTASYSDNNGLHYNLFIIPNHDTEQSEKMLNDYLKFARMEPSAGEGRYMINDRFNGSVGILWKNTYLCGFYNLEDKNLQEKYFIWFEEFISD